MIKQAFQNGVRDASNRFGVREASIMDLLLGIGTPMAAKAGLNVLAPQLMPRVEKALEVPFQGLKNVGQGALRAIRGPSNPAEAIAHGLSGTPASPRIQDPSAFIEQMSRSSR